MHDLMALIRAAGYACSYSSTKKKGWEKIGPEHDFIVLAGGDGTVRKVAGELLDRRLIDKRLPIGLLPLGTANNIARTLGLRGSTQDIIAQWRDEQYKFYDVGRIHGLAQPSFFLESFGYGIFPKLMSEMEKQPREMIDTPEKSLRRAWEVLEALVQASKGRFCQITTDSGQRDGKYILVEVMNTRSIGPNLTLASQADPGDGLLDLVMVSEEQRDDFLAYIHRRIKGLDAPPAWTVLQTNKINLYWQGTHLHIDDMAMKLTEPAEVSVELYAGLLHFLVPGVAS